MTVNAAQPLPLAERIQNRLRLMLTDGPDQVDVLWTRADPDEAEIIDRHRYCPAPLPCIGRPAVGISVPVRASKVVGERGVQVGLVYATYCPVCKGWRPDPIEPEGWVGG